MQIDQKVDEDWPIVIGNKNGKQSNITLKPGEMLLYESARVPHGRPYPLNGDYFDNIFAHFYPESLEKTIQSWLEDTYGKRRKDAFDTPGGIDPREFNFENFHVVRIR